ncbi:MAG: type II toxin-antitoxin system VapC family toxin [Deltaproteobacteria bacterium]|nr:type II toxin-antitoxin system VapC family toxin [Deltaproteobacteria bacterium]
MTWIFADEVTPQTQLIQERLLDQDAIVPSLWSIEVANVVLVATRRKRIKVSEWPEIFNGLNELPIIQDDQTFEQATKKSLHLANQHSISVYDATYLELAQRLQIPLATLDKKLKSTAKSIGVKVF